MLITLYASKEPTTDDIWHKHGTGPTPLDVVLRKEKHGLEYARIPWHHASKPDRRHKYKMLNCYWFHLEWV